MTQPALMRNRLFTAPSTFGYSSRDGSPDPLLAPRRDGERNEALDTSVYAGAALHGLISMGLRLNEEAEAIAAAKRRTEASAPSRDASTAGHPVGVDGVSYSGI